MDLEPGLLRYKSEHGFSNKAARFFWNIVWLVLFRPSPRICRAWRRFLLKLFGARMGIGSNVAPSCRIWAPWNLEMGSCSSMSDHVDCYNIGKVTIEENAIVSQYSYLCTASHDISDPGFKLVFGPIYIKKRAWIGTDSFISRNVTIGEYSVVGARSSVFKDIEPWIVVGGTPAKFIKRRVLNQPNGK